MVVLGPVGAFERVVQRADGGASGGGGVGGGCGACVWGGDAPSRGVTDAVCGGGGEADPGDRGGGSLSPGDRGRAGGGSGGARRGCRSRCEGGGEPPVRPGAGTVDARAVDSFEREGSGLGGGAAPHRGGRLARGGVCGV